MNFEEEKISIKNIEIYKPKKLIQLTKWNQHHEYPSISSLRNLVFTMPKGFEKVVKRVNGRILIDEAAWFEFVEKSTQEASK